MKRVLSASWGLQPADRIAVLESPPQARASAGELQSPRVLNLVPLAHPGDPMPSPSQCHGPYGSLRRHRRENSDDLGVSHATERQDSVGDGQFVPGDVAIEEGLISAVGLSPAGKSGLVVPRFIDVQINGFDGAGFTWAETRCRPPLSVPRLRLGVLARPHSGSACLAMRQRRRRFLRCRRRSHHPW